jgi:nitrite reductase (NADH) small subunit
MADVILHLGSIEQIPLGFGRCFKIDRQEVAIFRCRDGRVLAVQNRCPHRAGALSEGIIGDGKVVCPLHGHKFDMTTGAGSEPKECLKVYKAWADQGSIFMEYTLPAKTPAQIQQ